MESLCAHHVPWMRASVAGGNAELDLDRRSVAHVRVPGQASATRRPAAPDVPASKQTVRPITRLRPDSDFSLCGSAWLAWPVRRFGQRITWDDVIRRTGLALVWTAVLFALAWWRFQEKDIVN